MSSIALSSIHSRACELAPGFFISLIVAAAATFLSEHYGAPVMLFALLLGIALNFLSDDGKCSAGIEFTARAVLRIGVALLGMRITLEQIAGLGWKPVALVVIVVVVIVVVVTILVSVVAAKALGFQRLFGMLTGGATAICGASAALALAAALPSHPQEERTTLITRMQGADPTRKRPPLLPWFAVGFLALACINSTGWVVPVVQGFVNELSRWCLVIAISALGMKTQLRELAAIGIKPILLMVGETLFLVGLVLLLLHWGL
ncbi:hypothetical protein D3C80_216570 [compost metagenome]